MKRFHAAIHIRAPQAEIWKLLTDAAGWPSWNTTVEKVEGKIALGKTVEVYVKLSPGLSFPLKVSSFEPPRTMQWTGGMPLGLFTGTRTFLLTPRDGGVEFSMTEEFTGLIAPWITRAIPDLQPSFEEVAVCLKRRAEQNQVA